MRGRVLGARQGGRCAGSSRRDAHRASRTDSMGSLPSPRVRNMPRPTHPATMRATACSGIQEEGSWGFSQKFTPAGAHRGREPMRAGD